MKTHKTMFRRPGRAEGSSKEISVKVFPESNRRELSEMLSSWHSAMGDPIYALSSSWMDSNRAIPLSTVEGALSNIEADIRLSKTPAGRKKTGWTAADRAQLEKIARMIKRSIEHAVGGAAKDVDLDAFFDAYITAALWSSTDNSDDSGGDPLDRNYSASDFTKESLKKLRKEADSFAKENATLIVGREEGAGHDFWLTRNGHGAGFWDGDWPKEIGKTLTENSKRYGGIDIYVGDDKKLHV